MPKQTKNKHSRNFIYFTILIFTTVFFGVGLHLMIRGGAIYAESLEAGAVYPQIFHRKTYLSKSVQADDLAELYNEKYGYVLKYPSDWVVKNQPAKAGSCVEKKIITNPDAAGPQVAVTVFPKPPGTSLYKWYVAGAVKNGEAEGAAIESIRVNGKIGLEVTDKNQKYFYVWLNDNIVEIAGESGNFKEPPASYVIEDLVSSLIALLP
ncbi:MAG: hypothetical protein AAB871_00560 [Patescibacteria group bacterium]